MNVDGKFADYEDSALALNRYGIEPRYPADIPVYYSVEETKTAIKLAKENGPLHKKSNLRIYAMIKRDSTSGRK